jgi:thiol:disulfide interchange protein DsbC
LLCAAIAAAAAPASHAGDAPTATAVAARLPGVVVTALRPSTAVPGFYLVTTAEGESFYVDAAVGVVLQGQAFDVATRRNLTQEEVQAGRTVRPEEVPVELAIRRVKGAGRQHVVVIADPECPYCARLEQQLARHDDLTIDVLLYPIADLHPTAVARSHDLWCAPDRAAAWEAWMLEHRAPPAASAGCHAPLDQLARFAETVGVSGTPTLIFPSGRVMFGLPAPEALQYYLDEPAAATKSARGP